MRSCATLRRPNSDSSCCRMPNPWSRQATRTCRALHLLVLPPWGASIACHQVARTAVCTVHADAEKVTYEGEERAAAEGLGCRTQLWLHTGSGLRSRQRALRRSGYRDCRDFALLSSLASWLVRRVRQKGHARYGLTSRISPPTSTWTVQFPLVLQADFESRRLGIREKLWSWTSITTPDRLMSSTL